MFTTYYIKIVNVVGSTTPKSAKVNWQRIGNNNYILCKALCTYLFMLLQPFVLNKYLVIRGLYNEVQSTQANTHTHCVNQAEQHTRASNRKEGKNILFQQTPLLALRHFVRTSLRKYWYQLERTLPISTCMLYEFLEKCNKGFGKSGLTRACVGAVELQKTPVEENWKLLWMPRKQCIKLFTLD